MLGQDRFSPYALFVLVVAAFGGFLYGYHLAIISGILPSLKNLFSLSVLEQGFLVSTVILGGLIGSIFSGILADKWGRRRALLLTAILFCIGSGILFGAFSYHILLLGRFVSGFAIGLASVVSPLYLAEIAPPRYRGRFVCIFQLMLALGILVAYGINIIFATDSWRFVFLCSFAFSASQLLALFFLPETPAWLMGHQTTSSAEKTLKCLRDDREWKKHIAELSKVAAPVKKEIPTSLFQPPYRFIVCVGLLLSAFQQITGVNAVIYYAPKIFSLSGDLSADSALLATFGVGIINCLAALLSVFLLDKLGRRTFLLVGTFGMWICQILLACAFFPKSGVLDTVAFLSVMGFIFFFGIGLGPITWVILSEIFPLRIRGKAIAFALFANWLANYLIALTFLPLIGKLGSSGTFFMYALLSLAAFIFSYFWIPETKGKSLEQIEELLTKKQVSN